MAVAEIFEEKRNIIVGKDGTDQLCIRKIILMHVIWRNKDNLVCL